MKLLGLEKSKTVTPSQVAALKRVICRGKVVGVSILRLSLKRVFAGGGVVGVSILKIFGLENSKTMTFSGVCLFIEKIPLKW